MKGLRAIGLLSALLGLGTLAGAHDVGDPVTDFTLPGIEGDTVRLSSLSGQVVLVNFWRWT